MEKNVAGKWTVFAYGAPDHATLAGLAITGDAGNITANIRIDGGAANAVDDTNPTELEDGFSIFDITATENNGDQLTLAPVSSTSDVIVIGVPGSLYTRPPNFNDLGIEGDGDLTKVNALDGNTPQTADHTAAIAAIDTDTTDIIADIAALQDFDPAIDDVAVVTTLTNKTGFSLASTGLDAIVSTATGMVEIAKAIWDRVLTGATHNINQSAGRRLRALSGTIFAQGTAQSGGNNSIQLASGDITFNDRFRRSRVIITGGTGEGQENIITKSVASTDTLTVAVAWGINPDATSEYEIIPGQVHTTVRNGGYDNGMVYIDTNSSNSGTERGVDGTSTNPVNNPTDAYVIAVQENLTTFFVVPGSTVVLPSDSSGFKFVATGSNIVLNGQIISNVTFDGADSVTGIGTDPSNAPPVFFLCGIGTITLPPCTGFQCGFFGVLTIGSDGGSYTFGGSSDVFDIGLTIDFGAGLNASSFFLPTWGGGNVEIQNAGAGTGSYVFGVSGFGNLTVNANCSATTTVTSKGHISRNADVAGITYVELANSIPANNADAVWDEATSGHATAGTFGVNATDTLIDTGDIIIDIAALNDFDSATDLVDVGALNGDTVSLLNFVDSALTITRGTATGTPTTTTMAASALPSRDDDNYDGLIIKWLTGNLSGQGTAVAITGYDNATRTLTFVATTQAASAGDKFVIL